jgi:glycolate oxidase FAD binding subunit
MSATLPIGAPALEPRTTAELQAQLAACTAAGTRVRVVGRGTWLHAGRPVRSDARLSLHALRGIVEYVPGDLTLTAGAGTPIADLQAAAAEHRQFVPLDPWGGDAGSLGATLATATAGPWSSGYGLVRDLVLGVELVTGDGRVVRGGGRVVKNVAGFDLVRLTVGAWGTLGAITQATVRLRALPEVDETIAVAASGLQPDALMVAVRELQPVAAELLSPALAAALELGDEATLLVRVSGNAALVAHQRRAVTALGRHLTLAADVWRRLREVEPAVASVVRWSHLPGRLAESWNAALSATRACDGALVHASVVRGVVRAILPTGEATVVRSALAAPFGGTRIAERLPEELWASWLAGGRGAVHDRLSRGVRAAFDPAHVLNPGILSEDAS